MFRRWMTTLLAVMMLAMMPLSALADTQHTLTVIPGDALAAEPAVAELLDVLDLRLTTGEGCSALTVLMKDQEVLTLGLSADANGLFADSRLLGEDVLYVTWDDAFVLLNMLMEMSMQEAGVEDPEVLEMLKTSLEESKQSLIAAFENEIILEEQTFAPLSSKDNARLIAEAFGDDPEMAAIMEKMIENVVVENGVFEMGGRDTADQKYVMTMDRECFSAMLDTQYVRNSMVDTLSAQYPEITQEEVDMVLEEANKMIENGEFIVVIEAYTVNEGTELVGMDIDMVMLMKGEANSQTAVMDASMDGEYNRLTVEDGVSHTAELTIAADGEKVALAFELEQKNDGSSEGLFGVLYGGEEVVIAYKGENEAADTRIRTFDLYLRSGATAIIEPAASARPLVGVAIATEPASEDVLAKLENAAPETSVNVMNLSETELEELGNTITMNATQLLFTAMSLLPTSTLQLLMAQ